MADCIQGIMITVIEIICCKTFFEAFGRKRAENVLKNCAILAGMIVVEYSIAVIFYDTFLVKQVLVIIAITVCMFLYFKMHIGKVIVLSLLFQGLLLAVDYLTLWMMVSVFHSIEDIRQMQNMESCLMSVLAKVFLFTIILLIKKNIGDKSTDLLKKADWLRFMLFPAFTILTIIAMITTSGNIKNQKQGNVLLVVALCMAGMNIVVFYLINDILKREMLIRENDIFREKMKNQTSMYRTISENFEKQRRMTHEYKNQIMCIEALMDAGKFAESRDYVKKISGRLNKELDCIKTNNVIIDAILNSKYREMSDKNILFIFKINDLSLLTLDDEDIVVILSNLLNNAIEACEKCQGRKVIKMKLVREKDKLILSVKNTYDGELHMEDGEIRTSKQQDIASHGIGIKNIREVIEKYQGSYVIRTEGNVFSFSIILPEKE